jgi:hypothetical protein
MVRSFNLREIITTVVVAAALLLPAMMLAAPANAQIDVPDDGGICTGIGYAAGDGSNCGAEGEGDAAVQNIISTVVNILSIIVGALSVIFIIVGGLRYITSGGDSAAVQSARNTILYAIVGLLIVIFAQLIVRFVVDRATDAP